MNDEIVEPIIVDDNGDMEVYPTIADACSDLEAIDVQQGAYQVFDSNGLSLHTSTDGIHVRITAPVVPLYNREYLVQGVRRHCRAIGAKKLKGVDTENAPLEELLMRILALKGH